MHDTISRTFAKLINLKIFSIFHATLQFHIFFFDLKHGEDTCEINITVVGKPAAPGGPLNVSEVTKRGCLLQWKPPADNGGYQITHYEVEKMDMSMGSWLPVKSVNR